LNCSGPALCARSKGRKMRSPSCVLRTMRTLRSVSDLMAEPSSIATLGFMFRFSREFPLPIRLSRNRRYRRYIRNHHTRLIDFIEDDAREIRASGNTLPILVEMQRFFVRGAIWTSGEGADQNAEVTMMQSDPDLLTDVHRVVREVAESLRGNSQRTVELA
jgi:hypothetical protein